MPRIPPPSIERILTCSPMRPPSTLIPDDPIRCRRDGARVGSWHRGTWTASARSTSRSSPTSRPRPTCTSAASASSRARRPPTTTSPSTSPRAFTWCRASARSSRSRRSRPGARSGSTIPAFNLEYHVRHSALPSPGSEDQLRRMAARIFSQQLDRTKPLWELWLVQGLTRKRFAFVTKTHHALVDGVVRRGHRDGAVRRQAGARARRARPRVGAQPRAVGRDAAGEGRRGAAVGPASARAPPRAGGRASRGHPASGERVAERPRARWAGTSPTRRPRPRSTSRSARTGGSPGCAPTSRSSSGSRTSSAARSTTSSSRSSPARCASGCAVAGVRTEGMELRAQVPVSIRATDEHGQLGNRIAAVRGPDPRLHRGPGRAPGRRPRGHGGHQAVEAGARRRGDLAH